MCPRALYLERFAHQPQRRRAVAQALSQRLEDFGLVADGAPENIRSPSIRTSVSVQIPPTAGARMMPPAITGESLNPATDGLVGDVEPTLDDEILGRLARCTTSATSADDGGDDGEIGRRTYGTQSRNSVSTARLNQSGGTKCG